MDLVVSNFSSSLEELARQSRAQTRLSDALELRLDAIGDPGAPALRVLLSELGRPAIVAVNGPEAYGTFAGTDEERFAILRSAARAGASFVDIEWRKARALGPLPNGCKRILSRHVLEHTPEDLDLLIDEMQPHLLSGDRLKLVTHAQCAEDGVRVLALAERCAAHGAPIIAFASGDKGSFTRVLAPIFGSLATYAAPAPVAGMETRATAPGQLRADELRAHWPAAGARSTTSIFAVLGDPVRFSLSPRVHTAELRAHAIDAVYVACEPRSMESFLALVTHDRWRGFSITAPFKEAAARASRTSRGLLGTKAANTLIHGLGGWTGANTDAPAIRAALEMGFERAGRTLADATVVVLGTGGAARAAVAILADDVGVIIAGRDRHERESLAREFAVTACAIEELGEIEWDALVHATPLGSRSHPDELPLDPRWIRRGSIVLDAVYRPRMTALLAAAEKAGAVAVPGAVWFAHQAALQFTLFTGERADVARMTQELERALREDGDA